MINEFIFTGSVNKFFEICQELESDQSMMGPSLAMVSGLAGRGKTEAAKRFAATNRAVYLPPLICRSAVMLLRAIVFELEGARPYTIESCYGHLESEMRSERRLLLVDEADLLTMNLLELLRNLSDLFNFPMLLIGEDKKLAAKIHSRGRLSSRIRMEMEFSALSQSDVLLFFRKSLGLKLSPDVCQAIHSKCNGNWRPLLIRALNIERALKASGLNEVTLALAKAT